jgi:outer membrane autotransporter protein
MLSKRFAEATGGWVWTPYAALSAVREFDGDNGYAINGDFHGSTSTRVSSALVEGGFSAQHGGTTLSAGFNWQDGGALDSVLGGHLNLRYSW